MALTITSFNKEGIDTLQMLKNRNFGMVVGTIAFDSSYPTGGESAASLAARFRELHLVDIPNQGGYSFEYDYDNDKIKVMLPAAAHTHDIKVIGGAAPTEAIGVSGASNDTLSKEAATDRTIAGSASATKGGVVASSSAVGAEVANGTSLSALTAVRFIAYGWI